MRVLKTACIAALFHSCLAHASVIEISVTGVITESYEFSTSGGAGVGFADGREAVLTLRYDTNVAPPDLYGGTDPNSARYEAYQGSLACATAQGAYPGGSWIGSSMSVDGVTIGGILSAGSYANCDYIDKVIASPLGFFTAFDFADSSFSTASQSVQQFSQSELQLAAGGDWLGLPLDSVFAIEPLGGSFFSVRTLLYGFDIDADGNSFNDRGFDVYYRALATSAIARVVDDSNQLPEPSTLALLSLSALMLAFARGTRRHGGLSGARPTSVRACGSL